VPDQGPFKAEKEARVYRAHKDRVLDLSFTRSGDLLLSASGDSHVLVWDVNKDCAQTADLKGHSEVVEKVACHPLDSNLVLTASADKSLKLWDLRTKAAVRSEKTKAHALNAVWKPDGSTFACYLKDQTAAFFDSQRAGVTGTLKVENASVKDGRTISDCGLTDISWDFTGNIFMASTSDKDHSLLLFDSRKVEFPADFSLALHASSCFYLAVDPSGKYIATGGTDNLISLLNSTEFIAVKCFPQLNSQLHQMAFSHDGLYLAAAAEQTCVTVFDTKSGEIAQVLETPGVQFAVAWHPSRHVLAYGGEEKSSKTEKSVEGSFRVIGLGKDHGTLHPTSN
jgi:THO complex subunit 3